MVVADKEGVYVVAVDGPAASGKGTVAKKIASELGLGYLDTGKLYRAVGHKILELGHDPNDETIVLEIARSIEEDDIRNQNLYKENVGGTASVISAFASVREVLLVFQREYAYRGNGAVLDGRDIGTVVCPEADIKFFITAEIETRTKRRFDELRRHGNPITFEQIRDEIKRRDERDQNRSVAPLKMADDAIFIDTTDMDAQTVFDVVMDFIKKNPSFSSRIAKAQ